MSRTFKEEYEAKLKELENEINSDIEDRHKNGEILSWNDKVKIARDHLGYSHKIPENVFNYPVDEEGYIPFSIFEEDA